MTEPIIQMMSYAISFVTFVVLYCVAVLIYRQQTESPSSKHGKFNLMMFALLLSSSMIAEMIRHFSEIIGAEIYGVWAIRFFYSLSFLSVIFLVNALSVLVGEPYLRDFKEWLKKGQWKPGVGLYLRIFALAMVSVTFLPSALSGEAPSLWYNSMYWVFVVAVTMILVSYLWKALKISGSRRAPFAVWGGAITLVGFQFSHLLMQHLLKAFGIVYFSVYLIVISIAGGMILIGFKEKTALEHVVYKSMRPMSSDIFKAGSVLNIGEGEEIIVTYTSVAGKMKVFSAFIREGLESGGKVEYIYPDYESGTVGAKLKEYGIDVEEYEKEGALLLRSQTEYFTSDGKFDIKRAVRKGLDEWSEAKRKGYKYVKTIEDVGDFSFVNGQWQKWITEYWLDPRWDDPNVSEWVTSKEPFGAVYIPFVTNVTAINVEHMTETQVTELLKAFGRGKLISTHARIDLLEDVNSFSKSAGLDHQRLRGRKILLEFDPASNYENVVEGLAKENRANVEPLFVFTSKTSSIHSRLAEEPAIKFFLTSVSTSIPKSSSENTVLLPAKNAPLILDAISKVLETHADVNVCFVFNILSELLTTIGIERTFIFLRHALDMLISEKITSLFLLNTTAHETEVVSRLRNLFSNQLVYDKNGLEIVKNS